MLANERTLATPLPKTIEAAMTTIDFEDAIAELLHQIYAADPKDGSFGKTRSLSLVAATNRSALRLVPGLYEAHSMQNASK